MIKIILWIIIMTFLFVAFFGPSYGWMPSGYIVMLYVLDKLDEYRS